MAAARQFDWSEIFGKKLLKDGQSLEEEEAAGIDTVEHLAAVQVVAVYISAAWCRPCHQFLPQLLKFYKQRKPHSWELIFVSRDRDGVSFEEYYEKMPWPAVPYEAAAAGGELYRNGVVRRYPGVGLPRLLLFEASSGRLITDDGVACLTEDPAGADFPWQPLPLLELLASAGGFVLAHPAADSPAAEDYARIAVSEALKDKEYLALYFSSHSCGPCRRLTPILSRFYTERRAQGLHDLEIIFVSGDDTESDMKSYYQQMQWLALPFGDKRHGALKRLAKAETYPSLVIYSVRDGRLINAEASSFLFADPSGAAFPFRPPAIVYLQDGVLSQCGKDFSNTPTFFLFAERASPQRQDELHALILPFAHTHLLDKAYSPDGPDFLFIFSTVDNELATQKRRSIGLLPSSAASSPDDDTTPLLCLFDLPRNRWYQFDGPFTSQAIADFIQAYFTQSLPQKPFIG